MSKPKLALMVFIITWLAAICLFDYYLEDLCSQSTDYTMNDADGEDELQN